ncbi:CatB-related O-acetyltransferase [Flavobacterium azooxidireducens]|uniref:CatB-related O-acetyltransferase n=1 Tax=Flavobacterium azooxidireducens TaxID=1871076 RepID=UPI002E161889
MSFFNQTLLKIKKRFKRLNVIKSSIIIPGKTKVSGSTLEGDIKLSDHIIITSSNLKGKIYIGNTTEIKDSVIKGEIVLGDNNKIQGAILSGKIKTGRYTSLWGPNLDINSTQQAAVEIGNFCSIARNVSFQSYNHNFKKPTSYFIGQNFFKEKWENETVNKGNIILENDVWIGAHSVILSGVTIENGAVVAANSVVTKDVPAFAIVAGSPAKIMGYRFEPHIIQTLQELAWWNWSSDKIKRNKSFFENEIDETIVNIVIHE